MNRPKVLERWRLEKLEESDTSMTGDPTVLATCKGGYDGSSHEFLAEAALSRAVRDGN